MQAFDILIVEDDLLDQTRVKSMLKQIGYSSFHCVSTLDDAFNYLSDYTPSLIIADIFLDGETALDLMNRTISWVVPTIFVTVSKDISIYNSIHGKNPFGYLIKPIEPITLLNTINLVISKSVVAHQNESLFFINQGKKLIKILVSDILWLEVDGNYTFINGENFKYVIKKSISSLVEELGIQFLRCHNKFAVNIEQIQHIKSNIIVINNQEIPLSFTFKKNFLEQLQVLRNSRQTAKQPQLKEIKQE